MARSIAAMTRDSGEPPPVAGKTFIAYTAAPGAVPVIGTALAIAAVAGGSPQLGTG